jgi:hypothetical protein
MLPDFVEAFAGRKISRHSFQSRSFLEQSAINNQFLQNQTECFNLSCRMHAPFFLRNRATWALRISTKN